MQMNENYASELFDQFLAANTLRTVTTQFKRITNFLELEPTKFDTFYPSLKKSIINNWKAQSIFNKLDKKSSNKIYLNNQEHKILKGQKCLIIGAGPCGLRTAIELQLLGADHVLIVEKRDRISRNNVIHLWPFVIHDLKELAGKKLYSKFCAGSIDHISIRQLQLMLLKVALILGCDFVDNVAFEQLCPLNFKNCEINEECCCNIHFDKSLSHNNQENTGAFAHYIFNQASNYPEITSKLNTYSFHVLIGADGRRNLLSDYFPRKEFRGRLAIAITANFINHHTLSEAQVPEISGISFIYYQQLFKSLYEQTNIDLENICYYKDDTHYFVMTAKKTSLLTRGVLLNDFQDTRALLAPDNIDQNALLNYAKDAAGWCTGLDNLKFALNHYGTEDVAMFDFTSMYAAENACRAKEFYLRTKCCKQETNLNKNGLLLTALVGDSLLEPFWPTGSGCGRGFLSSMDTAWFCRQFAIKCLNNGNKSIKENEENILSVISERESIYRLLAQTKSENLNQNFSQYNLNPISRYPNLNNTTIMPHQCKHLLYSNIKRTIKNRQTLAEKRLRRITIACTPDTFKDQFIDTKQQLPPEEINEESQEEENETFNNITNTINNLNGNLNNDSIINKQNQQQTKFQTGVEYLVTNKQYLTPSAFNLASIEKNRNKEIESVIRHRKQREERLNQECLTSEERFMNHIRKQIKPKANWFLNNNHSNKLQENSYESNTSSNKSNNSSQEDINYLTNRSTDKHFTSKVQDLEFKLNNHNQFNEARYLRQENSSKHVDGVNVMVARLTLQDLLDPIKQEEKFREEVKRKTFLEKDFNCKFVGRLTDDWNFKLFNSQTSEDDKQSSSETVTLNNKLDRTTSLKARPKERIEIFKAKLKNIENILTNGKSKNEEEVNRLTKKQLQKFEQKQKNGKCGEWIEMMKEKLKNESNDRQKLNRPFLKKRTVNNSSSDQETSSSTIGNKSTHNYYYKNPNIEYIKYERLNKPTVTAIKTPDYHKQQTFNFNSLDRGSSINKFNSNYDKFNRIEINKLTYTKDNCAKCKDKVLTIDKIVINGSIFHRNCLCCANCGITLRLNEIRSSNNSLVNDVINEKNCICTLCSNENRLTRSNSTSNYSDKLKQRMKWKEIYLLNLDSTDGNNQSNKPKHDVDERIEYGYENTSFTNVELLDDEEVTKMLNLDIVDNHKEVNSKSSQSSDILADENSDDEDDDEDDDDDDEEDEDEESSSENTSTLDTTGGDINSEIFDNDNCSINDYNLPEIIVNKSIEEKDQINNEQNDDDDDDDEQTLNETLNDLKDFTETIILNKDDKNYNLNGDKNYFNETNFNKEQINTNKDQFNNSQEFLKNDNQITTIFNKNYSSNILNNQSSNISTNETITILNQDNQINKQKNKLLNKMISDINEVCLDDELIKDDDKLKTNEESIKFKRAEKSNSITNFNLKVEIPKFITREAYSKIPVLNDRILNETNKLSPSGSQSRYCGSFTDKVLKCKSTSSLNDNQLSFTSFYNKDSSLFKK